jgi:hypothetical protein
MTPTTITLGPADRVRLREVSRLLAELTERHDPENCECNLCEAFRLADAGAVEEADWKIAEVVLPKPH